MDEQTNLDGPKGYCLGYCGHPLKQDSSGFYPSVCPACHEEALKEAMEWLGKEMIDHE